MNEIDRKFIELEESADKYLKMSEKEIAKNYAKGLKKLNGEIGNLYRKHAINGQLTMEEMVKYNRIQKLDKYVYDIFLEVYAANRVLTRKILNDLTINTYKTTYNEAGKATGKKLLGIKKDIDVSKVVNDTMAGLNWAERYPKHRSDLIYEVQKVLKEGLDRGSTYDTMTKNLQKAVNGDIIKPNRIIRTEAHRVMSHAKLESFEEMKRQGVKIKKKWLSSRDERTRAAHAELDGTILPIDENFKSSLGGEGKAPGLMNNASDDIYCRCIITMVIDRDNT